ncbi:HesA/MoeB/ThiF family protein [Marinomonas sp. C2222]|uniref:HesA/MoeB/ThiF family protein n=1 Tax=Marinomonas sargassi TaxID=2984494 RepID=A0ABT2YRI6_9GAMM|nr:HesA/MoeB/ThiF family protein [Marinomonas sargassi]MCV2402490.1 HesA/MoeB/ThiF family protein [Marinomonas sargassi]
MSRYQRQTCLSEVGDSGQQEIAAAHVLVVGAGGLGCAVLPYLVSAGVGHISLVDEDTVSLSNLHRQVLYRETDLGALKVDCAKQHLMTLNDECQITTHASALTASNVATLCSTGSVDLVLDCADNFAVSYILSDYCHTHGLPLISASALGFNGYVGGFCAGKPSLRAVFPELPQRAQNCSSAGIMGPVVGTIGCIQAQFALNFLLKLHPSPLGQLLSIDLQNLRQSSFRFDEAPEPPLTQHLGFLAIEDITPTDWLVDLRGIKTQQTSENRPVQHLSLDDFQQEQATPNTNQRAVIVCRTGLTAWRAARILQSYWQGEIGLIALGDDPL